MGIRTIRFHSEFAASDSLAELKDTKVKVNSAHPGWVKAEMGTDAAPMEIPDDAKTSVQLALPPASGPTGGYFHTGEALPGNGCAPR